MKRHYHYLKKSANGGAPLRFLTVGAALCPVRTVGYHGGDKELTLAAWAASEVRRSPVQANVVNTSLGYDASGFFRWLRNRLSQGECVDLWCHGAIKLMGAFGWWHLLETGKWNLCDGTWSGAAVLSDPPVLLTMRPAKGAGVVRLLDIKNLGIRTLDELHDAVGASFECASDWWSHDWSAPACACSIDQSLIEYLDGWYSMIERENLGAAKPTLAGQAWGAFRRRFVTCPILVHDNQAALNLESEAIFQGRTECFRLGRIDGPLYHLDVSSQYPALALTNQFPARLKYYGVGNASETLQLIADGFCVIAECAIETTVAKYPYHSDALQVFPVGRFTTVLCGDELLAAIVGGDITKLGRVAAYEPEYLLKPWAEWCLAKRSERHKQGDAIGEYVVKQLTNALWGRLARRNIRWKNDGRVSGKGKWGEWYEQSDDNPGMDKCRSVAGLGQRLTDSGYGADAIPAVYAWLTMLGRTQLLSLLQCADSQNVCYCATDSLLVNAAGLRNLVKQGGFIRNMPGGLRIVSKYEWIHLHGIHQWETADGRTASGVPLTAIGDDASGFLWDQIEAPTGALRRNECPTPRLVPAARGATGPYKHGKVLDDGRIQPLAINEW